MYASAYILAIGTLLGSWPFCTLGKKTESEGTSLFGYRRAHTQASVHERLVRSVLAPLKESEVIELEGLIVERMHDKVYGAKRKEYRYSKQYRFEESSRK
jgi:hypothetical protein